MEIITAKSIAQRDGCPSVLEWIKRAANRKGAAVMIEPIGEKAVTARIDHGRWIADCEDCNGAEYVDPGEPVFFCISCLNRNHGGALRPVRFPEAAARAKIEAQLSPENYNSWNENEQPIETFPK